MSFDVAKKSLLGKLAAGIDFSPKGSIDAPIVQLVDFVNDLPDFVTTSSCSGRISVFRDENSTKGIQWILVVHGAITTEQLRNAVIEQDLNTAGKHLIVMKCEGFILHVRCRNLECGRRLHQIAMGCGFRESGLSVGQKMRVQLAIRTTAYGLELPIAVGNQLLLDDNALEIIVSEANRRLRCNFARTDRLLSAMKREYLWPSVVVQQLPQHPIQRWGHSAAAINNNGHIVVGGYGVEIDILNSGAPTDKQLSTRKLSNVCYETADASAQLFNLKKADSMGNDYFMHAAVSEFKFSGIPFIAVTGGRDSPQQALPILRIYRISDAERKSANKGMSFDLECMAHEESGDIPLPRWGHTLTALGYRTGSGTETNQFLLFGGRDEKQAFGDAYLLTLCNQNSGSTSTHENDIGLHFIWSRIPSPHGISAVLTIPSPRFFHAACYYSTTDHAPDTHATQGCFNDVNPHSVVLFHGGLLSLEDPVTCGRCYALNVRTGTWTSLLNISSGASSKNVEEASDCWEHSSEVISESHNLTSSISAYAISKDKNKDNDKDKDKASDGSNSGIKVQDPNTRAGSFLRRFGHTITDIGHKTLVLAGGVAFEGSATVDGDSGDGSADRLHKSVCLIDIQSNDDCTLSGSLREMNILNNSTESLREGNLYLEGLGIEPGSPAKEFNQLPCSDCRCHHAAFYKRETKTLQLLGGGALCLSFGAHYCTSVALQISSAPSINISEEGNYIVGEIRGHSGIPDTANISTASTIKLDPPSVVLLVPISRVKLVKNFLESQATCWFDKKRRITVSEVSAEDIVHLDLKDVNLCEDDFNAYDVRIRLEKVKEKKCKDVSKDAVKLLTGLDIDQASVKKIKEKEKEVKEKEKEEKEKEKEEKEKEKEKEKEGLNCADYMAVPIVPSFATILLSGLKGLSSAKQTELCLCLGSAYFRLSSTSNNDSNDQNILFSIKLGYQSVKVSKRLCASGCRKADEYLEDVVRDLGLDSTASLHYPRKYEIVGNVLMIPEDALIGPVWGAILPEPCNEKPKRTLLETAVGQMMSCHNCCYLYCIYSISTYHFLFHACS